MVKQGVVLVAALIIATSFCGCNRSASHRPITIVGVWRAQDDSNATLEFLKDGSWRMDGATMNLASNQTAIPISGTFKIPDSNHIVMALGILGEKSPFTLSYALTEDELDLQTFNLDGQIKKYRRVTNR